MTEFPTIVFIGSSHMKFYGPMAKYPQYSGILVSILSTAEYR